MAEAVYILCAATSIACAVMLLRGYLRSRARFLLWSSLCFAFLAINNALLFADKVLFPSVDMFGGLTFGVWRGLVALVGLLMLLYGLIWDAE
jgi:hypothetical protein